MVYGDPKSQSFIDDKPKAQAQAPSFIDDEPQTSGPKFIDDEAQTPSVMDQTNDIAVGERPDLMKFPGAYRKDETSGVTYIKGSNPSGDVTVRHADNAVYLPNSYNPTTKQKGAWWNVMSNGMVRQAPDKPGSKIDALTSLAPSSENEEELRIFANLKGGSTKRLVQHYENMRDFKALQAMQQQPRLYDQTKVNAKLKELSNVIKKEGESLSDLNDWQTGTRVESANLGGIRDLLGGSTLGAVRAVRKAPGEIAAGVMQGVEDLGGPYSGYGITDEGEPMAPGPVGPMPMGREAADGSYQVDIGPDTGKTVMPRDGMSGKQAYAQSLMDRMGQLKKAERSHIENAAPNSFQGFINEFNRANESQDVATEKFGREKLGIRSDTTLGSVGDFTGKVGGGIAEMLAAGALGGPGGAAKYLVTKSGASAYNRARQEGATPNEAALYGVGNAGVVAGMTAIPGFNYGTLRGALIGQAARGTGLGAGQAYAERALQKIALGHDIEWTPTWQELADSMATMAAYEVAPTLGAAAKAKLLSGLPPKEVAFKKFTDLRENLSKEYGYDPLSSTVKTEKAKINPVTGQETAPAKFQSTGKELPKGYTVDPNTGLLRDDKGQPMGFMGKDPGAPYPAAPSGPRGEAVLPPGMELNSSGEMVKAAESKPEAGAMPPVNVDQALPAGKQFNSSGEVIPIEGATHGEEAATGPNNPAGVQQTGNAEGGTIAESPEGAGSPASIRQQGGQEPAVENAQNAEAKKGEVANAVTDPFSAAVKTMWDLIGKDKKEIAGKIENYDALHKEASELNDKLQQYENRTNWTDSDKAEISKLIDQLEPLQKRMNLDTAKRFQAVRRHILDEAGVADTHSDPLAIEALRQHADELRDKINQARTSGNTAEGIRLHAERVATLNEMTDREYNTVTGNKTLPPEETMKGYGEGKERLATVGAFADPVSYALKHVYDYIGNLGKDKEVSAVKAGARAAMGQRDLARVQAVESIESAVNGNKLLNAIKGDTAKGYLATGLEGRSLVSSKAEEHGSAYKKPGVIQVGGEDHYVFAKPNGQVSSVQPKVLWDTYSRAQQGVDVSKEGPQGKIIMAMKAADASHAMEMKKLGMQVDNLRDNYLPNLWEFHQNGDYKGTAGQERTLNTMNEGIAKGLEPRGNLMNAWLERWGGTEHKIQMRKLASELQTQGMLVPTPLNENGSEQPPPPGFKKVESSAFGLLDENGKSQPVMAPDKVANILNAVTSKGAGDTIQAIKKVNNAIVSARFSASLAHASMIGQITTANTLGEMMKLAASGELTPKNVGNTVKAYLSAHEFENQLKKINPDPEWKPIVDAFAQGGMTVGMPPDLKPGFTAGFMDAMRQGQYAKAGAKAPFAAVEAAAWPIMEKIVPYAKKVAQLQGIQRILTTNPELANDPQALREKMQALAQSIDNRFGQLNYNNLLIKRGYKDAMQLILQAPGWQIGDIREAGGAVKDAVDFMKNPNKTNIPERTINVLALAAAHAAAGAAIYYMVNHKAPEEAKDYFYPQDEQGNRLKFIGYHNDVESAADAWKNSSAQNPVARLGQAATEYIKPKLGPAVTIPMKLLNNKDAQRREVWPRLGEMMKEEATPLSVKMLQQAQERNASTGEKVAAFMGVGKAPRRVSQTDAERVLDDAVQKYVMPEYTSEAAANKMQALKTARAEARGGDYSQLAGEVGKNISGESFMRTIKNGGPGALMAKAQRVPFDSLVDAYNKATPEEKKVLGTVAAKRVIGKAQRGAMGYDATADAEFRRFFTEILPDIQKRNQR